MSDLTRDQLLDALGNLYTSEFGDWELAVYHTLTEPTCPTAIVKPENEASAFEGFVCTADTLEEAIDGALRQAYSAMILREGFEPGVPWTNAEDGAELAKLIQALDKKNLH